MHNKDVSLKTYSRRDFLKITGITLAASQINWLPHFQKALTRTEYQGRALSAARVYSSPHTDADIVATLWPDSVSSILSAHEDWYRLVNGYVERFQLQPMFPVEMRPTLQNPNLPFWAEVAAPITSIRQFCAANAPLVTRIGHGGVARIIDYLPGEPDGWYGITDDQDNLMGWSQAIHWQAVPDRSALAAQNTIRVDVVTRTLSVEQDGLSILQAPCSMNVNAKPGTYALEKQYPGMVFESEDLSETFYGAPWQLHFGEGQSLIGAYWHNQFGKETPGSAIQVTPFIAREIYHAINENLQLIVS
jgi:hypothetical protein